jgi:flagellar biosynthesis protein FlhF
MKIKRFTAKNMREAMRQVREEQGADAVILSSRRLSDGIEVVAATDYDAALVQQALRQSTRTEVITPPQATAPAAAAPAPAEAPPAAVPRADPSPNPPRSMPPPLLTRVLRAPVLTPSAAITPDAPRRASEAPAAPAPAAPAPVPASTPPPVAVTSRASTDAMAPASVLVDLRRDLAVEIKGVRNLIEQQLAGLGWENLRSKQPKRAAVLRALMNLSLSPALAREIVAELPSDASDDNARYLPLGALARRIPALKGDSILDGGVVALIGATGVGKTTTVAKLAARYAARHGTRDIALVSTDTYRIGAQEQLHTYGRLLGVPVHAAAGPEQLAALLKKLADRRLVLIDTAGLAPRDQKVATQLDTLARAGNVRSYLALAAGSPAVDADEALRRFGAAPLSGCILTKLDEAARIGSALSVLIRRHLPLAYICDGQRVPEDLHLPRAYNLVVRAQQLAQQIPTGVDEDALALQFGVTHAAA